MIDYDDYVKTLIVGDSGVPRDEVEKVYRAMQRRGLIDSDIVDWVVRKEEEKKYEV